MESISSAISFLHRSLGEDPFQIWAGTHIDQEHVFSSRNSYNSVPPLFSLLKPFKTYRLNNNNREIFIFFCYPQDFRVCIGVSKDSVVSDEIIEQLYYYFYPLYHQKVIQKRDHEWETVMETTKSINSTIDTDQILLNIVQNAIKVIPAADKGYLQLFDEDKERLILKASVGYGKEINKFQPKSGESITGMTFLDGKSRIYHSGKEVLDAMFAKKVTQSNYHHINSALDIKLLKGGICVAISSGGKRIGNMMVQQYFSHGSLSERDIAILEGFAAQAAIAIQNASLLSRIKNNVAELTELSEQLIEKNTVLQKRTQVHETLRHISLENKGIGTIISELSRMSEKPVALFDSVENEFICADRSFHFNFEEIRKEMLPEPSSRYIVKSDEKGTYYLYPVKNGGAFLGYIIVSTTDHLSHMDIVTIEQGGAILSLELIKKNTLTDIYYKKTHESFTDLINNNHLDSLHQQAKELNLDSSHCFSVSIFKIKAGQDLQALELNIHRLVSFIKKSFPSQGILVYGFHNKVNLLISSPDLSIQKNIIVTLEKLMEEWEINAGEDCSVGIGSTYRGIENISTSYDEAQKALEYLVNRNEHGVIHYEKIGINRLFVNQPPQEIGFFLEETLAPLSLRKDDNELEKTLITYIEQNKSAAGTAKILHIHINTLYNRLKKIEELLNVSFQNPEDNLKIQLACHLRQSLKMG